MEKSPKEYAEPFEMCFDLLIRSFVHIYEHKLPNFKKIKRVFFIMWLSAFVTSLLVRVSKVFSGQIEFVELAYLVSVLMVCIQGVLKAAIVVSKRAEIRAIILQLGKVWRTKNLTEIQEEKKTSALKQLNIFHTVFYWMNILGSWQYILVPLFETLFRRFILQQETELLLPFACSFPFDPTETWTRYIAVYAFQTYGMIHLVYLYLGAEFLMITLCSHLSTQFIVLQEDLKHVGPVSNNIRSVDEITEYTEDDGMKCFVTRHQKLITLSNQLDELFNQMIFMNLLFASVTICFFGFVATVPQGRRSSADVINNIVGVVASILPIFNLCYYGQLLVGASSGIADAAYESLWYQGNVSHQKMLLFIIRRSQRPCCLTSMKYSPVTLTTFTKVLSTTWSYFSLATSMYEESV